jgi:pimeloyl-ACP methyl ester carboxylesterase
MAFLLALAAAAVAAATTVPIEAPGPTAPLRGSLVRAGANAPVVLIIPGSGPTDRDGNSPLGVRAAPYRLLAEGLAAKGIASVRIDKRGMFGSAAAIADANEVTVQDYVADVRAWIGSIRTATGQSCVWVLGHSEGGLIALAASQQPDHICGVILISAAGRTYGDVLRAQFRANPANAPILPQVEAAIAALEKGQPVPSDLHPALVPLFGPRLQTFMHSFMAEDPAALIARIRLPVMILQGDRDLQIGVEDARRLAAAGKRAELVLLPGANHVLKSVPANDQAANVAAYGDPDMPLVPQLVPAVADFLSRHRKISP